MYHIVEFKVDNGHEVAIVPHNWLKDNCFVYWPPYKTSVRLNIAARIMEPPSSETWILKKLTRVLYSNENFERVRTILKQSEETSDLQTSDDEQKRKRKPAKRLYESDDGDTDDENETDTESRPPQSKMPDQATTHKQTRGVLSPPPRLSAQALREASSEVRSDTIASPMQGPYETPSRGQNIRPTAVTQILRVYETMREENREIKRMMQRVLSRSATDDQPLQLPENISFPICCPEQMEAFGELLGDQTKLSSVVRYLSMFGGADVRETVDRLMKETMSNQLAREYNMKGLKGKKKFRSLQILNVLYKCVQRNGPTRNATRKDVEMEVSKWLAGARDRDGGRKARNKVSQSQPEPSAPENEE
ncbi:hypothetical protein MAR_026165, partial [Mya arenaria]